MIKSKGLPYSVYSILYRSCICSVSQYGSEVFGYNEYNAPSKLQLRAARAFLGLPKNVTSCGLISELGWLLPHCQTRIKMINYFSRILHTPSQRLLFKVFKWDHCMNESGQVVSWSSEVKSILEEHNLGHIYQRQELFSAQRITEDLKRLMMIEQQQALENVCASKPKLKTFLIFKDFAI